MQAGEKPETTRQVLERLKERSYYLPDLPGGNEIDGLYRDAHRDGQAFVRAMIDEELNKL
jgi:hypothetical protein